MIDGPFELKDNVLTIRYTPVDDSEALASMCMRLIESDKDDLFIIFNPDVDSMKSIHIGCIMTAKARSIQEGKILHVKCSEELSHWLKIIGGDCLDLEVYEA